MNYTNDDIKAMGYFLAHYGDELSHIKSFQANYLPTKRKRLTYPYNENNKSDPKFWECLTQFRVARTLGKENGQRNDFIQVFNNWDFRYCSPEDVDRFCAEGEMIKNHKSLASKMMMLANPWQIIPYDKQASTAVGYKASNGKTNYVAYLKLVHDFECRNKTLIASLFNEVDRYATKIEQNYKDDLENIQVIRRKRLLDKVLWTYGN